MNEDERIKKLIRSNLSGPGHHKLFIKETHWRSKPKQSDLSHGKDVVKKLKEQDPTQCEFFRSPWKYNESAVKITNEKD
jgi:hypothetical protein